MSWRKVGFTGGGTMIKTKGPNGRASVTFTQPDAVGAEVAAI
jgi:hypothetical protein